MNCQSAGCRNEKLPVTFESKRSSTAAGAGGDVGGLSNPEVAGEGLCTEDAGEGLSTRVGEGVTEAPSGGIAGPQDTSNQTTAKTNGDNPGTMVERYRPPIGYGSRKG